jgi:dipeptidyl aminopeptidase/acylaminoacyl peptidase
MSELRDRFRALDALDVPDVMSRARMIGPKPPEPDREPPVRRIGALVVAAVIAIAAVVLVIRALDQPTRPADPTPTPPAFRQDGEVITYSDPEPRESADLVATDPKTGAVRTIVAAKALRVPFDPNGLYHETIGSAAWSADGGWVAFEIRGECIDNTTGSELPPGLWVTNGVDEPLRLTTRPRCENAYVGLLEELWEWSPAGAQLVVRSRSVDGDGLVLIDPATGERTDLGETNGDVTSLAWSPDGSQIAYGTVPTGSGDPYSQASQGAVYSVDVGGGDHVLLASSVGVVSGGETGSGIRWSPDGSRIAITAEADENGENRLYLMNADGSDLELLTEGVVIEHILGSPNVMWSADGSRIAYATSSEEPDVLQVWNGSPDGSTPVLVFEAASPSQGLAGGPVWSPDGTRIAFRYSLTEEGAWLVANADGTGDAREFDELRYLSWRGGWYFCECYG